MQITGYGTPRGNGKAIAQEHTTTGFAIGVMNDCNSLPEEVVEVRPARKFRGRLDDVRLDVFAWDSV